MKGWKLFEHSVLMVLRNGKEALRICLVPVLLALLAALLLVGPFFNTQGQVPRPTAGLGLRFLLLWLIAVNWHRFVLLEEHPESWIPKISTGLALGYFGRSLLLGLLITAVLVPFLMMGLSFVRSPTNAMAFSAILGLVGSYLFFRFAAILPSGAVGKPIRMTGPGGAWQSTSKEPGAIATLVVIATVVSLLIQLIGLVPGFGKGIGVALSVIFAMVNLSILTTLYGHYVENRPID